MTSQLPVDSTKLVESRKFWKENIRKRTLMAEGKCIKCFTLNEKLEKLPRGRSSVSIFFAKGAASCSCNLFGWGGHKSGKLQGQPPDVYTHLLERFLALSDSSNFCRNLFSFKVDWPKSILPFLLTSLGNNNKNQNWVELIFLPMPYWHYCEPAFLLFDLDQLC